MSLYISSFFHRSLSLGESRDQLSDGGLSYSNGIRAVYDFAICQVSEKIQNITRVHVCIHDSWPDIRENKAILYNLEYS